MGVRPLLLLARLLLFNLLDLASPGDAPPEGQAFVFLGHADKAAGDEHLLLDAVAIYTRDLGIALLRSPGRQPAGLSPGALDDVVALLRARRARLAFWCQGLPGGRQIELVTVDPRRTVARYPFDAEGSSRSDVYRSIALRLRAILVGAETGSTEGAAPPSPTSAAPPPPAPVLAHPEKTAAVAAPERPTGQSAGGVAAEGAIPVTQSHPESPVAPTRLFFGAGYALSSPLGAAGGATARHALALDVMVAMSSQVEWDFGTDLAPASDRASSVATISVMDVPLRVGGRWVRPAGPFRLGAGPFVGVHWLSANATAGPLSDHRSTFEGSAGVQLLARGPILAGFAPQLGLWAEANVPRTRFIIQGIPNYDAGAVRLGLNIEIVALAH